jgi:hypothetical protein
MGVMKCSRKGCNNTLCRTYIIEIGYICNNCINEFKEYIKSNNIKINTELDLIKELTLFMGTDNINKINIDDYFKSKWE